VTDFAPLDTFRDAAGRPDPARAARLREDFRARIASMPPDDEGRRPFDPAPASRRARRPALALALVAALVVAATGALVARSPHTSTGELEHLAARAERREDRPLGPGELLHLTETAIDHGSETTREQWTAVDGTGGARTSAPAGQDPPALTMYTAPGGLDFAGMSYDELRHLPTEPDALVARLDQLGGPTSTRPGARAEALARVAALDVTPPGVVAAAIRALEQLGGRAVGPVPDGHGRVGIGVRGDDGDGTTWFVVLDPDSGAALAVHDRMAPGAPPGTTAGRAWTDQSITTRVPDR